MNALRAVPAPNDAGNGIAAGVALALADDGGDIDSGNVFEPATDPEALLLCALMWSFHPANGSTEIRRITAALTAGDFDDVAYGRVFTIIAGLVTDTRPYDPASVTDALIRSGADGAKDALLRRRLNGVITAGAEALLITHYADIVLSQAYRRSFRTAGTSITQAAEELPEEQLFDHMVTLGRRQRDAFARLEQFRRPDPAAMGGRA
ncbi:DnaB-like helicase N-terminal domain-containing protein [Rhodococcoides fascians]|uniref:DnaB-like helicase N-terminal domain-containing protein n=1 Tax=Rhodococcoides fascians TaxID=1828 RepID=UPI00068C8E88|nr:DnaB-like helicase N-terminal domain-containing protein [Rhodococcus fascians]